MSKGLDYVRECFPESDLIFHDIPYEDKSNWLKFRGGYIGGSDVGIISGINPYNNSAKIYYQKLGIEPPDPDAEIMWHGRMLEPYIDMCWKYWDGIDGNFINNHRTKKQIRNSFKFNGYVQNPKFPHLIASPDRFIDKDGLNGGMDMVNFEPLQNHGILELKMLSYWGNHSWEDGFPKYYILQIQHYLLVCELDYAEVCILHEGNRLEVHPFYANKSIQDSIVSLTKKFYNNHLKPGLEAKAAYDLARKINNRSEMSRCKAEIQMYEPEPDNSESYKQFLSDTFKKERESVLAPKGSEKTLYKAKLLSVIISRLRKSETGLRNKLINFHHTQQSEFLDYPNGNSSRWFIKSGNTNHQLNIKVKDYPTKERVDRELSKIELYE